jgi:hypothetical protein
MDYNKKAGQGMIDKKSPIEENAVYTTAEAAKLLGVSETFLTRGRKQGFSLVKFVRLSNGIVRYRGKDLLAYLDSL